MLYTLLVETLTNVRSARNVNPVQMNKQLIIKLENVAIGCVAIFQSLRHENLLAANVHLGVISR